MIGAGTFVIYVNLALSPKWWWLITAGMGVGVRALFGRRTNIHPPTFFRCRILRRSTLRDRLEALGARAGVHALDIYEWTPDAGTGQTNARLMGGGDRCRILLSKHLLADFTPDEVEVIVAHELGHHVHRDIRNGNRLRTMLTFATAGVAALALDAMWRPLGLFAPNDVAGWPILVAGGGARANGHRAALEGPVAPHGVPRRSFRDDADRPARRLRLDAPSSGRLGASPKMRPSLATVWLFHSHPSVDQRIQAARASVP